MKEVTTDGKRSDVQVLGLKARKERTRERKKEREPLPTPMKWLLVPFMISRE
jgi:hypothetical protein